MKKLIQNCKIITNELGHSSISQHGPSKTQARKTEGWSLKQGDKSEQREGGHEHLRLVQLLISSICELCPPVIRDQNASNCNTVFLEPRTWHYLLLSLNYKIWTSVSLYCTKKPYFFHEETHSKHCSGNGADYDLDDIYNKFLPPTAILWRLLKKEKKRGVHIHIYFQISVWWVELMGSGTVYSYK